MRMRLAIEHAEHLNTHASGAFNRTHNIPYITYIPLSLQTCMQSTYIEHSPLRSGADEMFARVHIYVWVMRVERVNASARGIALPHADIVVVASSLPVRDISRALATKTTKHNTHHIHTLFCPLYVYVVLSSSLLRSFDRRSASACLFNGLCSVQFV